MPLRWDISPDGAPADAGALSAKGAPLARVAAWPHRSLTTPGFAWFIGLTCAALLLPLLALVGTPVMWGILPFLLGALALIWAALRRSDADGRLSEVLTLWPDRVELVRRNPRGPEQRWDANPFWVRIELHPKGGPVENYITLRGGDRTVEIGAFLSPEERQSLYADLRAAFARARGR